MPFDYDLILTAGRVFCADTGLDGPVSDVGRCLRD